MQKICDEVDLTGKNPSDMGNADGLHNNGQLCMNSPSDANIDKEYGDTGSKDASIDKEYGTRSKDSEGKQVVYENLELSMHGTSDASIGKQHRDMKDGENNREEIVPRVQRTHFLARSAGLIICALQSQMKFMSRLFVTLLLAWYHLFLFALNPWSYILKAKVRALETSNDMNSHMVYSPKVKEKVLSVQSTLSKGARRLVFGCSAAFYTIMMLTLLFVASLMLSYFVVNGFVYERIQLYEDLYFDYTKSLPAASVDFPLSNVNLEKGGMLRRIACPTRKFSATVLFTLPESDFNKELGIFQVTTELLSTTGQVLLSRTQPCMLQFRSTALQRVKSLVMAVPLLTGLYSETQTLMVSPLEWQDRRALSFAAVRVMLAPRAGRPSAMGLPELYDSEIYVNSELPIWASVIGNWRWTISVWVGLGFFIGVVVLLLCLCNQLLIPDLGLILSYGLGECSKGKATCKEGFSESAFKDMHGGTDEQPSFLQLRKSLKSVQNSV